MENRGLTTNFPVESSNDSVSVKQERGTTNIYGGCAGGGRGGKVSTTSIWELAGTE